MPEEPARIPLTVEGIEAALERSSSPESRQQYIESLRKRVAAFEERNKMRTKELLNVLQRGELKEAAEVAKWLITAQALEEAEGCQPR